MKINTRTLATNALLCGITILLGFTPLGMIPLPPPLLSPTTVHIPVLIATLYLGYKSGLVVAICFGLVSFLRALQAPVGMSVFFINPLIAILPRLMIPTIAYLSYHGFKKIIRNNYICLVLAAALGSFANTIFTLSSIFIFYNEQLTNIISSAAGNNESAVNAAKYLFYVIAIPYGTSEAILSGILVPAVVSGLNKSLK